MNGGVNVKITKLPVGLRYLLSHTFSGCPNVKITAFGSNDNSSILESIEQSCFYNAGNGTHGSLDRIEVYSSVSFIGRNAFKDYGKSTLKTAGFYKYDAANDGAYGTTYIDMGLENVTIEGLA